MRADRLLSLILLLQIRGKLTTQTLARELGVSRRTILRDIDVLSASGIPIYCEGGHGGGVALDEEYRTTLTGLNTSEVQTLFTLNNTSPLRDIGLGEATDRLLRKLLATLPASHRLTVAHIRQRLMIDPSWWWHDTTTPGFWDTLQQAVYEDKPIAAIYEHYDGEIVARTLFPYSLVNKSGLWYLVAERSGELRTYRVARFHQICLLDQTFSRRDDYDLPQYWQTHLQDFIDSFSQYRCTLRIHTTRLAFVKSLLPGRWELVETDADEWTTVKLTFDSPMMARMMVFGLGHLAQIVEPQELAEEVLTEAQALITALSS